MSNQTDICQMQDKSIQERLAALAGPLLLWYGGNARILPWRACPAPYSVWVSEIMLQQTRVEAVIPFYMRFMEALPDLQALAEASEETLLKLWQGLGYYSRVRNLQKGARQIIEQYGGELPKDAKTLGEISGIGPYTAGAISSIAFGQREAAVDGNVLRILSRISDCAADISLPAVQRAFRAAAAGMLPEKRCGDFNQALMDLGATICLANTVPKCEECPVFTLCLARKNGTQRQRPVKAPAKERRTEQKTVFIISCGDSLLLRKRADKGLLAGMWELPNTAGFLDEKQAAETLGQWGLQNFSLERMPEGSHIFTHIKWEMLPYAVRISETLPAEGMTWADKKQREQSFALPSAFAQFIIRIFDLTVGKTDC